MDQIPKLKMGETKTRWLTAIKDTVFGSMWDRVMLGT